jgi:hypothetical protein
VRTSSVSFLGAGGVKSTSSVSAMRLVGSGSACEEDRRRLRRERRDKNEDWLRRGVFMLLSTVPLRERWECDCPMI